MKVRFILKQLINQSSIKPIEIVEMNHNIIETKSIPTTTKREDQLEYILNEPNDKVIKLKEAIASQKKVSLDSLQMFKPNLLTQELYDGDLLKNYFDLNDFDIPIIYCINKTNVKVTVDFYQNNIEKLSLKLASTCSLLMVKQIINTKLSNQIPVLEQKLYCIGLYDRTNQIRVNTNRNKQFEDSMKVSNIISIYMNSMANLSQREIPIQGENCIINFLLVRQINNKLQMGLNFKFNYFKSLSKISFNSDAPNYRECSDGINLFSYCRNSKCSIYNELFVIILGYGCFDIIREANRALCPKCSSQREKLDVKNIGLINSKWNYKGILYAKKDNIFEGDGITIDDKLYILPEANIINLMTKLIIEAKPYKNNDNNRNGNNEKDNCSLNSISLCLPNEDITPYNYKPKKKCFGISLNNTDGIQVYENECEFNIANIQIDKEENIICKGCNGGGFVSTVCLIF